MGPGGPMNDMNRGPGGPFSPPGGRNMGGRFDGGGMQDSTTFAVPADKCGLVIGKGEHFVNFLQTKMFFYTLC